MLIRGYEVKETRRDVTDEEKRDIVLEIYKILTKEEVNLDVRSDLYKTK